MNHFPFEIGKIYKLSNGSSIIFYDDEVQIDRDIYSYSKFNDINFLNTLSAPKKKLIIDIYTNGANVNIKINK